MSIDDFIRNPPWWVAFIAIAILAHHAVKWLIEVATASRRNHTIQILEFFIVFVLGFLALHAYYEAGIKVEEHAEWVDKPFALVIALILFALASMGLYIVSQSRTPSTKQQRAGQSRGR